MKYYQRNTLTHSCMITLKPTGLDLLLDVMWMLPVRCCRGWYSDLESVVGMNPRSFWAFSLLIILMAASGIYIILKCWLAIILEWWVFRFIVSLPPEDNTFTLPNQDSASSIPKWIVSSWCVALCPPACDAFLWIIWPPGQSCVHCGCIFTLIACLQTACPSFLTPQYSPHFLGYISPLQRKYAHILHIHWWYNVN